MIQALLLLIYLATILVFIVIRSQVGYKKIYLVDIFLTGLASHCIGSILLESQHSTPGSRFLISISLLAFLSGTFSSIYFILNKKISAVNTIYFLDKDHTELKLTTILTILTLINIGLVFYLLSNPGLRVLIFSSFFDDGNLLDVRKAITASTEGYMSPGLIKIVRDTATPISLGAYILYTKKPSNGIILWFSTIVVLVAIVIGGQRFPAIVVISIIFLSLAARRRNLVQYKFNVKQFIFFILSLLIAIAVMNNLLGRSVGTDGSINEILNLVVGLFERAVTVVPNEAFKTYQFWIDLGPTFGMSWLSDLAILIPGQSTYSFSSLLHTKGGGSELGNAPLFFAADSWMAFGLPAVILSPIFFGGFLHFLDFTLNATNSATSKSIWFFLALNIPMMYSPFLFLLNGGIVILPFILYYIFRKKHYLLRLK